MSRCVELAPYTELLMIDAAERLGELRAPPESVGTAARPA